MLQIYDPTYSITLKYMSMVFVRFILQPQRIRGRIVSYSYLIHCILCNGLMYTELVVYKSSYKGMVITSRIQTFVVIIWFFSSC